MVVVSTTVSIIGCLVVAFLPSIGAAIAGFALAGVAVGALVPLAFTSAGALVPARGDKVIARVNLFNYAGAVLGAVLIGLLADAPGLGLAFLLPAAALVGVLFVARRFRAPVPVPTTRSPPRRLASLSLCPKDPRADARQRRGIRRTARAEHHLAAWRERFEEPVERRPS